MSQPVRVLAIVDSDSNLKWASATLDQLGSDGARVEASIVVLRNPLSPSAAQTQAAMSGASLAPPRVLGPSALRARIRLESPDVVLIAAVGPIARLVARAVIRTIRNRPALVSGLPGAALAGLARAARWRDWTDAFVVHSRREVADFGNAFAALGTTPRIVLSHLPFLRDRLPANHSGAVQRLVFAPQAKAPADRADRVALLDGLARLGADGFEIIVKLRARAGERQTHNEQYPFDELWEEEHRRLGHREDLLTFAHGPIEAWLSPGTALLTVSSTAAIESLALGRPTIFIADFGVSEELLNEPLAGSGCMLPLEDVARVLRAGGPVADADWSDRNYLHTAASMLPEAFAELAARRRAGNLTPLRRVRPVSLGSHLRTAARVYAPGWLHRWLHRTRTP